MRKINIGSGDVELPGWVNTDLYGYHHLDLLEPWPIDGIDYIYGDNVIEHFCLTDVRRVLIYMYDAIRPGGVIRLVTPDVERNALIYINGGDTCQEVLDRHRRAAYQDVAYPADVLRVVFATSGHHEGYLFDYHSLSTELQRAGFVDMERCEVGDSSDQNLNMLEKRNQPADLKITLVIEARRSGPRHHS